MGRHHERFPEAIAGLPIADLPPALRTLLQGLFPGGRVVTAERFGVDLTRSDPTHKTRKAAWYH